MIHAPAPGYRGDGGGLDPLFLGQAQARLNEQCRKAQVTQAAVDARAAELEARERAAARAPWSKYPGVLAGDIEGRKKAEEACSRSMVPEPPAPTPGNSVTGNCNRDEQGSVLVEQDRTLPAILAGMLYDFCGHLTTRPEGFFVGGAHGPHPVLNALVDFAAKRGLSLEHANVERWREAAAALALPQVQAGPGTLQREAASHAPASPLTTVAGLPDGRGKR